MKKITRKKKRELDEEREHEEGPATDEDIDDADLTLSTGIVAAVADDAVDEEFDTDVAKAFYLMKISRELVNIGNLLKQLVDKK